MIIARCPIPEALVVPLDVCFASYWHDVTLHGRERNIMPECPEWIACDSVWPHTDDCYSGELFITMTVTRGGHRIGDALSNGGSVRIAEGSIAVIDPAVLHWVTPPWRQDVGDGLRAPWVGLQWAVKRENAPALARDIVKTLGGNWERNPDPRYVDWQPLQ